MTAIRNPAPVVAGGRVSEPVLFERLDGSKDTRIPDSVQRALPAGFDPVAMPMLARQVDCITVFINTSQKLSYYYKPDKQTCDPKDDPGQYIDSCLPALFGFANKDWAFSYPMNSVFNTKDYAGLVQQMQLRKSLGQIPLSYAELDVLKNDWWGIEGGWTTDSSRVLGAVRFSCLRP